MFQRIKDAIKNILTADWFENTISLITAILTIVSIWIGINQLNTTIKHEAFLTQKATMLEQSKELPYTMQSFIRTANKALVYNIAINTPQNEESEENCKKFEQNKKLFDQYNAEQDILLDKLTNEIIAYGTQDSIAIFSEFTNSLRTYADSRDDYTIENIAELYYSLPLLMSVVKYDTTGELVHPSVMLDFLMPEYMQLFKDYLPSLIEKNNELVDKYQLNSDFKWINTEADSSHIS